MKTAIISDIHGNLPGLHCVLEDIRARKIEQIVCLGDLVEGGNDSDRIVSLIREQGIVTVQGNHDLINDLRMEDDNRSWLEKLPEEIVEGDVVFTHVSPRERKRSLKDRIEAWNVFSDREFRICFIGHTHMPLLFGDKNDEFGEARVYEEDNGVFEMNLTDRYIVSFGAIGYPRAGGQFIRYGIYEPENNSVEFIRMKGALLEL